MRDYAWYEMFLFAEDHALCVHATTLSRQSDAVAHQFRSENVSSQKRKGIDKIFIALGYCFFF